MLKVFSMLLVGGATAVVGVDSAQAGCGCSSSATARAPVAAVPATAARPGVQSIRRYSAAPGAYQAPAMRRYGSYRSRGPSWSATRKVLGH
ncbi:MAG TPA: hypothetical protein VMV10_22705 [Pirellulales bacterium]|nr:hypothetical protein [Pirellulales bacterium]